MSLLFQAEIKSHYDYIIVGAGTSGCVLSRRLSELLPNKTILVIESGGSDEADNLHIPQMWNQLIMSEYDWKFTSAPQIHAFGRSSPCPQGKVLGGSGSIGAMVWGKGIKQDYDNWAQLTNCDDWSFQNLDHYFTKIESLMPIQRPRNPHLLALSFIQAAKEMGIEEQDTGLFQLNIKNGMRASVYRYYLHPCLKNSKVQVLTSAHVKNLIIEGDKCTGVEFCCNGKKFSVNANTEVILSAGAISSPKILLLSGIGPKNELKKLDILCVKDLPGVGKNLSDHYGVRAISYESMGPLLPPHNNSMEAFFLTKSHENLDLPDTQTVLIEYPIFPPGATTLQHGYAMIPALVKPKSRGHLTLANKDPFASPIIDFNYFFERCDLQVLIEAVRFCRKMGKAHAFKGFFKAEITPGDQIGDSEKELEQFIKKSYTSFFHPVGTCKMGHDSLAVVDTHLRVHGIGHLRVVDASIMPEITRSGTNAPTMVIAEKAAELIAQGVP